ncbi:aldo/keto reductase [Streptomyces scopuliridis]|uniref:aldo/keto reductase n=1 Tax=Streptomyces scopuliridis TaxID=452529 RepID=UPI0036BF454E
MTVALGLGTYRIDGERLADAALRAAGCSPSPGWIDTAPNYCHGHAHRLLSPALAAYPGVGVGTKVGFLTATTGRVARAAGVVDEADAVAGHSLNAPYVAWQMDRNRSELGRQCLDLAFLHNPERTTQPDRLKHQLREGFAVLEAAVDAGHVASYGVATWGGFTDGAFTVPVLDQLATEAAGTQQHHLRAVQLPVSLVMADAFAEALRGRGPIQEAAERGWQVQASAPLHGGELPTVATKEVAALIKPGFSVAAACVAAVASCPGVSMVLLSSGVTEHWYEALATLAEPPIPHENLRTVLDVLATPV